MKNFKLDPFMLTVTVLLLPCVFLWFYWLFTGVFDHWYPAVGSFVAIFGGFTASIVYQIRKNKKK